MKPHRPGLLPIARWTRPVLPAAAFLALALSALLLVRPQPVGADGLSTAIEPKAATPTVIVLQPVTDLPAWVAAPNEAVATNETEFQSLLQRYSPNPGFIGTTIVTDDPNPPGNWPPVSVGIIHQRVRFRDKAYYNTVWEPMLDQGWVPGFLQQVEVDPPPAAEEGLYDLDVWQRLDPTSVQIIQMRVRASDGGIGVVSSVIYQETAGKGYGLMDGCNAGPWWDTCCKSQLFLCRAGGWIIGCMVKPARCLSCMLDKCSGCYNNCLNCVNNPCHSCDPCGLSWLLCRIVPFGQC